MLHPSFAGNVAYTPWTRSLGPGISSSPFYRRYTPKNFIFNKWFWLELLRYLNVVMQFEAAGFLEHFLHGVCYLCFSVAGHGKIEIKLLFKFWILTS